MEPIIKQIEGFTVIGMTVKTNQIDNQVPMLWQQFLPRAIEIKNKSEDNVYYGICKCNPDFDLKKFNEETYFEEIAGVKVDNTDEVPENMIAHNLKGGKYAIFTHKGTVFTLKDTYNYIWGTWVPRSKEKIDMRDDFELYGERFLGPENENSEIDICIPLK